MSASAASPAPFTTHPMTATFTGLRTAPSRSSTWRARPMRSTWQRPHVGQLMISGPCRRTSSDASSVQHARTSVTGSSVSEIRKVSPMPSSSSTPRPQADLMMPWKRGARLGDADVQRHVRQLVRSCR